MEIKDTYQPRSRAQWRKWLEKNHKNKNGIWLIFYKKHTGKNSFVYSEALDEALCFGWIDSILKKIDDERYAQRFTPRKQKSRWSEVNKRKVRDLIKAGRMTRAGMDKITFDVNDADDTANEKQKKKFNIPPAILSSLRKDDLAWKNFNGLAPSYRRLYILWITDAKKEETFQRRLNEAVELLRQNKKLGMK